MQSVPTTASKDAAARAAGGPPVANGAAAADNWRAWLSARQREINARISSHLKHLKSSTASHGPLLDSVQYSLAQNGKRLRPMLVLEACRVCGGDSEKAWPAALAIECVHTFSLIHDDLPAMDDDDLRRGVPTNHKVYGEAVAILAADWLAGHAFELMADEAIEPRLSQAWVRTLAGATLGMILGQGADIAGEKQDADPTLVTFIHQQKTARLIEGACRLGALAAGASADMLKRMAEYGRHFGLAFQISDDLLDRTGSTESMGKRVGKDADASKQTYPAAFGIEKSREQARAEIDASIAALKPFGPEADNLRHLATYVCNRDR